MQCPTKGTPTVPWHSPRYPQHHAARMDKMTAQLPLLRVIMFLVHYLLVVFFPSRLIQTGTVFVSSFQKFFHTLDHSAMTNNHIWHQQTANVQGSKLVTFCNNAQFVARLVRMDLLSKNVTSPHSNILNYKTESVFNSKQEVKVIWQKAPHGRPIPRLGVTHGGRNLYHWIPGVGIPISVP